MTANHQQNINAIKTGVYSKRYQQIIQVIQHKYTVKLSHEKPLRFIPRYPTVPKIIVNRVLYLGQNTKADRWRGGLVPPFDIRMHYRLKKNAKHRSEEYETDSISWESTFVADNNICRTN